MTYSITMAKKDIMFFCALLESSERYAIVRTVDSRRPLLDVIVAPDYEKELNELLELIRKTIDFEIVEVRNE